MKAIILIPAYNEARAIEKVIQQLQDAEFKDILVVNDGSEDRTGALAEKMGIQVVHHLINRGLGGALGTGLQAAVLSGADYIVSFDADGQHQVEDIKKVLAPLEKGTADMVIGSRLMDPEGMPWSRRLFNRLANLLTFCLFHIWVTDSQSGLRGFTRQAAQAIEIQTNRMEVSSEFIREIKDKNLRLEQVPIEAVYTPYSLSKGQSMGVGLKTFYKLILYKFMN